MPVRLPSTANIPCRTVTVPLAMSSAEYRFTTPAAPVRPMVTFTAGLPPAPEPPQLLENCVVPPVATSVTSRPREIEPL